MGDDTCSTCGGECVIEECINCGVQLPECEFFSHECREHGEITIPWTPQQMNKAAQAQRRITGAIALIDNARITLQPDREHFESVRECDDALEKIRNHLEKQRAAIIRAMLGQKF